MNDIKTVKIKIWGIVQGVGFRPFVAKLADHLGIKGEVLNIGGLVDIVITDTPERIQLFIDALKKEKPAPAELVHMKVENVEFKSFNRFKILDSNEGDDEAAMIPADLSICPHCLQELQDENNPRYMHPFISCMVCGPRYTIIDRIPYDRDNTSMIDFSMCEFCKGEYTNRADRRYHAQTISCHECGPVLHYRLPLHGESDAASTGLIGIKANSKIQERALQPLSLVAMIILRGGIIALKGVGGYYFVCSPFIGDAVKGLRKLKNREDKPFAVMFKDIGQIKDYCKASGEEEKLLLSSARPIVLLEQIEKETLSEKTLEELKGKTESREKIICQEVYKTSRYIGAFLPSMGIQHMLVNLCGPLIMTSANLSDMPIIKDEEEILQLLENSSCERTKNSNEKLTGGLFAGVFYNERKIRISLDDSVVRVIDGNPQMIRRSKGYAPVPLYLNSKLGKEAMILATGGQLKSSFSLSKGPFAYVSQYLGDLDSREACQLFRENVSHMENLFRIKPGLVVSDLHPLYYTTHFAEEYAKENQIEHIKIQHHHAHTASVIAENHLKGPVIGVSFDGTGYGTDGAIWGGEFLLCQGREFSRMAQLEYVKMLGGDSSMKEGWKSAMSYLHQYGGVYQYGLGCKNLGLTDAQDRKLVIAGLENNINTIKSSSMGRLFDAVAAFLGIQDVNRYEGECAIMLENSGAEALKQGLAPLGMQFDIQLAEIIMISAEPLFRKMEEALESGINKNSIALGFHQAVANMILQVCSIIRDKTHVSQIALSGGVFQNKILMEESLKLLRNAGFGVYYNISVSPNDGGICLGQNYLGMLHLCEENS